VSLVPDAVPTVFSRMEEKQQQKNLP